MIDIPYLEKGDFIEFEGARYRFESQLGDGVLMFHHCRTGSPLQVPDGEMGPLVLPTVAWFLSALREDKIVICGAELTDGLRRAARLYEFDCQQIREIDPLADRRQFIAEAFDRHPVGKSEKSLTEWLRRLYLLPDTRKRFGNVPPSASAVQKWLRKRGTAGDRRMVDMLSLSGKTPRRRRMDAWTLKRMQHHALCYYTQPGASIRKCYADLVAELAAANPVENRHGEL